MTAYEDGGTILELDRVELHRSGARLLAGVSWILRPGEHWLLFGPNGSGKTSLLRLITGYVWPSRGSATVLGRRFGRSNIPELRQHIGWISSALAERLPERSSAIEIALSGFDASIGIYRTFSDDERARAKEALALVGAEDLADRSYGVLSQGEKQRVLIARGLAHGPELVILDEPCAGLDPAAREDFLADLERLVEKNGAPTMIFVTHHVEEVRPFLTHALVLAEGRTVAQGPLSEALNSYALSTAFGRRCRLEGSAGKLRLLVTPDRDRCD